MTTLRPDQHHPTLYFDDGNVVLSAYPSTLARPVTENDKVYFRVHTSILRTWSPVMDEMFAIPPLHEERAVRDSEEDLEEREEKGKWKGKAGRVEEKMVETYDGVLHIETPDSLEDVESFLKVLYDPLGAAYKRFNPNTPVLVNGALKLAIKYECDALRARIVENLEADWPQTLAQWDARRTEAIMMRSEHAQQQNGKVNGLYLDDRLPEPASAIRIASDYNIPSILPAAFYELSLLSTDADWDKYRSTPAHAGGKHLRFGARTARWNLLDKRDLMRLVHGQKLLAAYTRAIGTDIFGTRCPRIAKGCSNARADCWKYFQQNAPVSMDDPLDVLHDCMQLESLFTELPCPSCLSDIKASAEKKRRELWTSLPSFFNLNHH
ncbi:hypothetical protein K474DRAFT_73371 [Panus rudis PR-1116 ss-1]|nr:hypothetical protein K474DRAFT_73371 [Panus rudis PR-1116 ss-1]